MGKSLVKTVTSVGVKTRSSHSFNRVTAFVVALENYRRPSSGEPLPSVDFAHADADAFVDAIRRSYANLPAEALSVHVLKDADASLTALRDELRYTIKNLAEDELFIFYYAGHGFHGAGGNRLSTFDTNRANIEDTSLPMRDELLEPLVESECNQALVFVDACAEKFSKVVKLVRRRIELPTGADRPKDADVPGWNELLINHFCPGEPNKVLRQYLKSTNDRTWQLVNWLTHDRDANKTAAIIAHEAVSVMIGHFIGLVVRDRVDLVDECPQCSSRNVRSYYDPAIKPDGAYYERCKACNWSNHSDYGSTREKAAGRDG